MSLVSLMELAGFFMAHGVWTLCEHPGPLVPLAAFEKDGERSLTRFPKEGSMANSVAKAQELIEANAGDADSAVVLYDAVVTIEDERSDALVIHATDFPGGPNTIDIYQPYRPANADGGFALMAPKLSLPEHLSGVDVEGLVTAFFKGVDSHEAGGPVWNEHFVGG